MEFIKNIFTKKKSSSEEEADEESGVPVIEVDAGRKTRKIGETEPIIIKSVILDGPVDVQKIGADLRDGNIVILNISPLMDKDPAELKRAVDQLRGIASDIGGDIGRVSESRIIATPDLVKIQFKREG